MRIATWNINGVKARQGALELWLRHWRRRFSSGSGGRANWTPARTPCGIAEPN